MIVVRRFQFSLRTVFVVITGLCLGFGLLIHRTLPWLHNLAFLDLLLVVGSSAGLLGVLILFAFFLRDHR
jgi:hypothetical protein